MSSLNTQATDSFETSAECPSWQIKLLYDGECPLCLREVNFLRKKDAGRGLVVLVDIADKNYNPQENEGISYEAAMGRIHALLRDGTVVKNVEVFRQVYSILGIGWIYEPTKWPVISTLVDKFYEIWASARLALTGRPSLKTILEERKKLTQCQTQGRCNPR